MIPGALEGLVALIVAVIGGVFIFGQVKSSAERNAEDIEAMKVMIHDYQENMKVMIHEYQEDMKDLISKNLADVKDLIDANKENQKDALNREILHIKDMITMTSSETREDIKRLEARQDQANHLREKYAILAQSVKSLHHRLDIEPPALLEDDN